MRTAFFILCAALSFAPLLAQESDDGIRPQVQSANRRTALRCLSLAKNYAGDKDWSAAISQATLGLAYDETLSDLWYILSLSNTHLEAPRAKILPLVQRALDENNWVDYNRDGARLMYADLLCDTGRFYMVPQILDAGPMLYSADAEFIRAKAFYRMGTPESVSKARDKIESARRIYPSDTRFPLLFFKNESHLDTSQDVRRLADFFTAQALQYVEASPDKDAELEIYAARFSSGKQKEHLLKSFSARGLRHPLYAVTALECGLISERSALRYLVPFAEDSISLSVLREFIPMLTDESVIAEARDYLASYSGVIVHDTDGDGLDNLYVKYSRGRPETIYFDRNQDGETDWTVVCDYGVPVSGNLAERRMNFSWSEYPYLSRVDFLNSAGDVSEHFSLLAETLKWTPLSMEEEPVISSAIKGRFFFPATDMHEAPLTNDILLRSCSSFTVPSSERAGAVIEFTVLSGHLRLARYYADGKLYAQTEFQNDVPVLRVVDKDGDGIFETTEFYAVGTDGMGMVHSLEDESAIMVNLFGVPSGAARFYLRMVQVDMNGDTVPNFTEEYVERGGKIASWDTDGDGIWETRYVLYPSDDTGEKIEESFFRLHPSGELISVKCRGGVPYAVFSGQDDSRVRLDVSESDVSGFYWLGRAGSESMSKKCAQTLDLTAAQGVCAVVSDAGERAVCVRFGSLCYGMLVPEEDYEKDY